MRSSSRFGKLCQNPNASPELHVGNAGKKDSHISPELEIAAYPNFDNLYNGFKEELVEVTQAITQAQIAVTEIEADNSASTIFSTLSNAVDPLIPKATLLTPKDIAELPSKVEFGATKDFCPVTLAEKKMMIKGTRSFAAKYQVISLLVIRARRRLTGILERRILFHF